MQSLAVAQPRPHVGFVPTNSEDDQEQKLLGRALAALRLRARYNQSEAAAKYAEITGKEDFTPQAWGLYEGGKRRAIFRPEVQRQLAEAVEASLDDFQREADRQREPDLRDTPGVAESPRPFRGPVRSIERRETVFNLPEGDVVLAYPSRLSSDGMRAMADYLKIFVRQLEERATAI